MKYLQKVTRELTLPSGAKVTVRQQTKLETILIGPPPAFCKRVVRAREKGDADPEITPQEEFQWEKYQSDVERVLLTRCVVGPLVCDGEELLITDSEPDAVHVADGFKRLSWAMIHQSDKDAIIAAINQITALPTGPEAVKTFREETPTTEGRGRDGEALQSVADGPPQSNAA